MAAALLDLVLLAGLFVIMAAVAGQVSAGGEGRQGRATAAPMAPRRVGPLTVSGS